MTVTAHADCRGLTCLQAPGGMELCLPEAQRRCKLAEVTQTRDPARIQLRAHLQPSHNVTAPSLPPRQLLGLQRTLEEEKKKKKLIFWGARNCADSVNASFGFSLTTLQGSYYIVISMLQMKTLRPQ